MAKYSNSFFRSSLFNLSGLVREGNVSMGQPLRSLPPKLKVFDTELL